MQGIQGFAPFAVVHSTLAIKDPAQKAKADADSSTGSLASEEPLAEAG